MGCSKWGSYEWSGLQNDFVYIDIYTLTCYCVYVACQRTASFPNRPPLNSTVITGFSGLRGSFSSPFSLRDLSRVLKISNIHRNIQHFLIRSSSSRKTLYFSLFNTKSMQKFKNTHRDCIAIDPSEVNYRCDHREDKHVLRAGSHCVYSWMVVLDHFPFQPRSPSSTFSICQHKEMRQFKLYVHFISRI